MNGSGTAPRFGARRLTERDAAQALALYRAAGRDGAWAHEDGVARACREGRLFGGFAPNLTLCGGLCDAQAFPELAQAVEKTELLPSGARLLLPPAGEAARGAQAFFQLLLAKAAAEGEGPVWLPVPVKTGAPLLCHCFAAGFSLRAMRPLYLLRPHYFFESSRSEVKKTPEYSIMIPISDTLTLSRLLECGMRGVALRTARGGPAVCLADDERGGMQYETGDSGALCADGRRSGLDGAARACR